MIFGVVRDNSPRVRLALPGLEGPLIAELVVDTGFEGDLALPSSLIRRLNLTFLDQRVALMPDGRAEEVYTYLAEMEWQAELRRVEVMELEGRPLLGMLLLSTSHLHMEGNDGGEIVIEPL